MARRANISLRTGTKRGIVQATKVWLVEIIEKDRVDDLFYRYSSNILGAQKGERDGCDGRRDWTANVHLWRRKR